ncbi:hypothetical protein SODG_004470 [Sodalis praecaptivus]
MHIADTLNPVFRRRGAADAFTQRNAHAGHLALKGPEHKYITLE